MATSESDPPSDPQEATKRSFREALDRKKAKSAATAKQKDAGLKQPRAHGAVENRREFRRRSGG